MKVLQHLAAARTLQLGIGKEGCPRSTGASSTPTSQRRSQRIAAWRRGIEKPCLSSYSNRATRSP